MGDLLLGHHPIAAVEIDAYCQQVLSARQKDGQLPWFPIFGDIKAFDGRPWRGLADVVAGGFPCQDISSAGKGAGIGGAKSGLWYEMARIIREVRPRFAFLENSPLLTGRGLDTVLGDLAEMGFDAEWCVLGAHHAGAPHKRDRIWILADADRARCGLKTRESSGSEGWTPEQLERNAWWPPEPPVSRVVDGLANRVGQLRALGNGQVPRVAAMAWRLLMSRLNAAEAIPMKEAA